MARRDPRWLLAGVALVAGCRADASLRGGLLSDASASESPSWERPPHVHDVRPGSFGEHAEAVAASIVDGVAPLPAAEVLVADPRPPVTRPSACDGFVTTFLARDLTDGCRDELARQRTRLTPLLEATHAARAGLPTSLRSTDPAIALPRSRALFLALRDLEIGARAQLASGRPDEVLAACADRLALTRDLTWGGLLLDDTIAQASAAQVLSSCVEAAGRAPSEARRKLADDWASVRAGMPPFVHVVRRERALMEVRTWGHELDDAERARLPDTLRREVTTTEATRDEWRAFRAQQAEVDAAMQDPDPAERLRRTEAIDARAKGLLAPTWAPYLALHDGHLAAIDVAVWALRATAGELEGRPLSALPPELARSARLERRGAELVVTVTVVAEPPRAITLRFGGAG